MESEQISVMDHSLLMAIHNLDTDYVRSLSQQHGTLYIPSEKQLADTLVQTISQHGDASSDMVKLVTTEYTFSDQMHMSNILLSCADSNAIDVAGVLIPNMSDAFIDIVFSLVMSNILRTGETEAPQHEVRIVEYIDILLSYHTSISLISEHLFLLCRYINYVIRSTTYDTGKTTIISTYGIDVIRVLLKHGADVQFYEDDTCLNVLISEIDSTHVDILPYVSLVLDYGADLRYGEHSAVTYACNTENIPLLKVFIIHGIPDIEQSTSIHMLIDAIVGHDTDTYHNREVMVRLLLNAGIRIHPSQYEHVLDIVLASGNVTMLEDLINAGLDPYTRNIGLRVAFSNVIEGIDMRECDIIEYLFQHGAHIECVDILHILSCIANHRTDLIELVLKWGFDIHQHARLVLEFALVSGSMPMLRILLEHGANPNTESNVPILQYRWRDDMGNACQATAEQIWMLLDHGANPYTRNTDTRHDSYTVNPAVREWVNSREEIRRMLLQASMDGYQDIYPIIFSMLYPHDTLYYGTVHLPKRINRSSRYPGTFGSSV